MRSLMHGSTQFLDEISIIQMLLFSLTIALLIDGIQDFLEASYIRFPVIVVSLVLVVCRFSGIKLLLFPRYLCCKLRDPELKCKLWIREREFV